MKKFLVPLVVVLVLVACASQPTIQQVVTTQAPAVATSTTAPTQVPTDTPIPTVTFTPAPTSTPKPTPTPLPTYTPEPTQAPIILTGKGNQVVDVKKPDGPMLLHTKYTGSSNFFVYNYDVDGNQMDLLVNVVGSYEGTVPLDFEQGQATTRFEVKGSGSWEFTIMPLSMIRLETIPGTFTGKGDDVVAIYGGTPDTLTVDAKGKSNFFIYGYGRTGTDLVVNEIAPYSGTSILSKDTQVLVINAEGPWTITVNTR